MAGRRKKRRASSSVNREDLVELVDTLMEYFEISEDSYGNPPIICIHSNREGVSQGLVDPELHNILMDIYEAMNQE